MPFIRKPFFVVPLDLGSVSGSAVAGHPASNLNRFDAMALTWQGSGGGTVSGNFGASREVDFCAILAANAAPGTTVRVQVGSYDSGAVPFIAPAVTRKSGLYSSHIEFPSVQTSSSWSVTVSHSGTFEAPFLVLGKKIEPSRYWDVDIEFGIEDTAKGEFTRLGIFDREDGVLLRTVEFVLSWQTEEEFETKFRPMVEELGQTRFAFLSFDPEPTTYRQNRTYFGRLSKPGFATGKRMPRRFGQEFKILSVI